jgi:nucleoside-diphosphate-sugar epimerase
VNRLLADTSKMQRLTGWQSRVALREGLSRTVEWIGRNPAAFDPGRYHQ